MDLDSYGGTDPLGMFPLFMKWTADALAPRLAVVFRRLVRLGSCLVCPRVILFKFCSMVVGGSVLTVLTQFLSNRSQYAVVDGCHSKLVRSAVLQKSVLVSSCSFCAPRSVSLKWKTSSTVMLTNPL